MRREHDRGEYEADDHIYDGAGAEGQKRLPAGTGQLAEPRGQADAEEAENEGPGPQILDRRHQRRNYALVEIDKAVARRYQGDDERRHHKAEHEFRKPPPDLGRFGLAAGLGALPLRGGDDGQHEGPDADPYVAADHLDQRISEHGLIAAARNRAAACNIAVG